MKSSSTAPGPTAPSNDESGAFPASLGPRSTDRDVAPGVALLARAPRTSALRERLSLCTRRVSGDGEATVVDLRASCGAPAACAQSLRERPGSSRPPASGLVAASPRDLSRACVPFIRMAPRELCRQDVDPEAAFVLGLLDGHTSVESVLDTCPLAKDEAMRLLGVLLARDIIDLEPDVDVAS